MIVRFFPTTKTPADTAKRMKRFATDFLWSNWLEPVECRNWHLCVENFRNGRPALRLSADFGRFRYIEKDMAEDLMCGFQKRGFKFEPSW